MSDPESDYIPSEESLVELISRIQFRYLSPIDFRATDHDSINEIVRRLTQAAKLFNLLAVHDFGGRSGTEREPGLCEQVLGSAFQICFGEELHPDPFDKASFIFRGIVGGHPFEDGNKRTGFLLVYYYLAQVGYPPTDDFSEDAVVKFCFAVSRGDIRALADIEERIVGLWGYSVVQGDGEDFTNDSSNA